MWNTRALQEARAAVKERQRLTAAIAALTQTILDDIERPLSAPSVGPLDQVEAESAEMPRELTQVSKLDLVPVEMQAHELVGQDLESLGALDVTVEEGEVEGGEDKARGIPAWTRRVMVGLRMAVWQMVNFFFGRH